MKKFLLSTLLFTGILQADPCTSLGLRYDKGDLYVLNQQKLPQEEEWITVETPEQMVEVIRSLKVRGAPLIGVSAAFSLAQMAQRGASIETLEQTAALLRSARPTAVNLMNCIDRIVAAMRTSANPQQAVIDAADEIFNEDVALCNAMGEAGAELIQPNEHILTYCNTGGLATAGIGTAIGVIKTAHSQGKNIHVYVCETRPLLQGGRLTAWEMEQNGIPYTLICDNMAATLMKQGKIDRVLLGADRIASNGDFANKIGTYSVAVLAKHHHIPFHVVAPYTTIDPLCPSGDAIKIEERSPEEVKGVSGSFGKVTWSPKNAHVFNPAFDVTPAELVTSYILDVGVVSAAEIPNALRQTSYD